MVLDVSGSMGDSFYEYSKYTGKLDKDEDYYIKTSSGIYEKIEWSKKKKEWIYKDTYNDGKSVIVTQGSTDIFTKEKSGKKLEALKNAATSFVDNVATTGS